MAEHISIPANAWRPPVEDWGKIEDEVYKFSFEQAVVRFNESLSISEDITNKSQKLMIAYSAFITAALGASFKIDLPGDIIFVVICYHLYGIALIIHLLTLKKLPFRGDRPSESFPDTFNDPAVCKKPEEQIKLTYYHALKRYEIKIEYADEVNERRAGSYQFTLLYISFLLLGTILFMLYFIFHPL